jgi:hypothetical protein
MFSASVIGVGVPWELLRKSWIPAKAVNWGSPRPFNALVEMVRKFI